MAEELASPPFQAHPWHGVPARSGFPDVYNAFIEIVPTDAVKYELDKISGHLRIDRPQRFSSMCPTLYGFVPRTLCGPRVGERCSERSGAAGMEGDGDPMDICVLTEKPVAHGNLFVHARPIGGLRMVDGTRADDKIVAVLESDLAYGGFADLSEVPGGILERLRHYFLTYKQGPDEIARRVRVVETYARDEALEMLARSEEDYADRFRGRSESRGAGTLGDQEGARR